MFKKIKLMGEKLIDIFRQIQEKLNEERLKNEFKKKSDKNYALRESGAVILEKSKGIKYPKSILSSNIEEYLIIPDCSDKENYLIINLSEDIVLKEI